MRAPTAELLDAGVRGARVLGARVLGAGVLIAVLSGAGLLGACDSDRTAIDRSDLVELDPAPVVTIVAGNDDTLPTSFEVAAGDPFAYRNDSDGPREVRGTLLHTGMLEPGESTLLVLDTVGTHTLIDAGSAGVEREIEVTVLPGG